MKRNLTANEEQVIRLVHHDFGGKSIKEAAVCMGRKVRAVQRLLRNAKKKAPRMFPILTPRHRAIISMYDLYKPTQGNHRNPDQLSIASIAAGLEISESTLEKDVEFLYKHGFLFKPPDQYHPSMDGQVKEKF